MEFNLVRSLQRRERHRVVVREEVYRFQQRFQGGGHAAVLEKLGRDDLTSYYLGILRDVERELRPQKPGVLERLGLKKPEVGTANRTA